MFNLATFCLGSTLCIHCGPLWSACTQEKLQASPVGTFLELSVNPPSKLEDMTGVLKFTSYLSRFAKVPPRVHRYQSY